MPWANGQRQLSQLSECLIALPPENDGMLLSEFDGFVAGVLVCPEVILPSEWLPIVWGEEIAPHFADMGQAEATLDAVMAHYNRVARGLSRDKLVLIAGLGLDEQVAHADLDGGMDMKLRLFDPENAVLLAQ